MIEISDVGRSNDENTFRMASRVVLNFQNGRITYRQSHRRRVAAYMTVHLAVYTILVVLG